jgi:hypothetical protein
LVMWWLKPAAVERSWSSPWPQRGRGLPGLVLALVRAAQQVFDPFALNEAVADLILAFARPQCRAQGTYSKTTRDGLKRSTAANIGFMVKASSTSDGWNSVFSSSPSSDGSIGASS